MIVGQNALLNQYVPTFYIKDLKDGQTVRYDAVRKAFVNADGGGGSGADRLGDLLDVSDSVDNPLSLQNGQSLVFNSFTDLWENTFIDYNTLLNRPVIPTNGSFSFVGLSDTATPSLPDGYVRWNSTGTQLVYSTTIPVASITGLAQVATTGDYNSLINQPTIPTNNSFTFIGLSDTATPAVGDGYVRWNSAGTQLIYSTTISSSSITGLSTVATTGNYNDLLNTPGFPVNEVVLGSGTGMTSSSGLTYDESINTLSIGDTGPAVISADPGFGMTLAGAQLVFNTNKLDRFVIDSDGTFIVSGSAGLSGQILTSNGPGLPPTWGIVAGTGSVTSVSVVTANGISGSVANPSTTPEITLSLGNITPTSVAAAGTITGSNLSGTNTGDQTITLNGDVTGSGTGTFATTLATVNATTGTFGTGTQVPQITVDAKGRITNVVNVPISESGLGTVTEVSANGTQGVTTLVTNSTSTPNITIGLDAITPTSVAATGTVTGSNLSGTNTGDQTITLSGDATGSGTGIVPMTLNTVNLAPGVYGDSHFVPSITVNAKGLVTSITTQHVDTSVRDLIEEEEILVIAPRHQYIVTTQLEVDGYIVSNGVIAIL